MKSNLAKIILIALLFTSLNACKVKGKTNSCENGVEATIKDLTGLDGCGIVLELETGEKLELLNLNEFPAIKIENGKKVWVSYHLPLAPMGSVCMVGDMVIIDCIAER